MRAACWPWWTGRIRPAAGYRPAPSPPLPRIPRRFCSHRTWKRARMWRIMARTGRSSRPFGWSGTGRDDTSSSISPSTRIGSTPTSIPTCFSATLFVSWSSVSLCFYPWPFNHSPWWRRFSAFDFWRKIFTKKKKKFHFFLPLCFQCRFIGPSDRTRALATTSRTTLKRIVFPPRFWSSWSYSSSWWSWSGRCICGRIYAANSYSSCCWFWRSTASFSSIYQKKPGGTAFFYFLHWNFWTLLCQISLNFFRNFFEIFFEIFWTFLKFKQFDIFLTFFEFFWIFFSNCSKTFFSKFFSKLF